MNSWIAAQIKILREQREWSQQQLADRIGTKQAGISRLENVNHTSWKVHTLTRLARAFDVRLRISFEEYGTLPNDLAGFDKHRLRREGYGSDPVFSAVRPAISDTIDARSEDSGIVGSEDRNTQLTLTGMGGSKGQNECRVSAFGTRDRVSGNSVDESWRESVSSRPRRANNEPVSILKGPKHRIRA
jgi:transcriptional regulator with XRE-family HTH domain